MKYIRISLIIISVLTLVSASLTLCRVIPAFIGIAVSLTLVACDFALQAVVMYKLKNKMSMLMYMIAVCVIVCVVIYNVVSKAFGI